MLAQVKDGVRPVIVALNLKYTGRQTVAFLEWIHFNFFDLIKDVDEGKIVESLKDTKVSAATSGHGYLVFGDALGYIHLVSRSFQVTTFRAYNINVSLAEQLRCAALLVTVGEDEVGLNPIIKVWNFDNLCKHRHPKCIRMSRITSGHKPVEATALCVHENLNYMAVGFADGCIILYKGEVTKEQSSKIKVLKNGNSMITGLAFHTVSSDTSLFVATESNVYLYNITTKDMENRFHLDSMGCAKRCSVLAESIKESYFMIGKNDAIYCYTPNGRGPCYAVDGFKIMLQWFQSHLVIVTKNRKSVTEVTSCGSPPIREIEMHMITVLDIQNKFIVFSAPLQEIQAVLTEWGTFYILGGDNKLYHLRQKPLCSKLALLFKKNLYDVAIRIARSQNYHSEGLIDIYRQYGNYLYTKHDHNAAMKQYIKTIGKLESSYIIRKYLDSQHLEILITYLQALHKHGLATEDHTTLLLSCYMKQNNTEKLKEFVMTKDCELDFEVEIAIKVCRQASPEIALLLARKHDMHDWYLKIEIEDREKYREALEYISSLELAEAKENMKKYGTLLIKHVPDEATQFLNKLCTGYRPNKNPLLNHCALDKNSVPVLANPEDFIHLFLNNTKKLIEFLEHIINVKSKCSSAIYNTIIQHYLHAWASEKDPLSKKQYEQKVILILQNCEGNYDRDQFLILSQIYTFKSGILQVYEEHKFYEQIAQYHIKQQEYNSAMASYRRFGRQDPKLWVQALWLCTKDPNIPSNFLTEVLSEIEKQQLLSPLLVVDVLSNSSNVTLGEIQNYLLSVLVSENELIEKEQELIEKYRQESERVHIQIEAIQSSNIVFQGSRCSACHHQLEFPAIYFLCHHCYHQHCFQTFTENRNECPACLPENKRLLDMIKSQEQRENLHETFHNQLEKAEDGFSLVAEYFGHGVFNKLIVIADSPLSESITRDSSAGERTTSNVHAYEPNSEVQLKSLGSTAPGITERQVTVKERLKLEKNYHVNSYCPSLKANLVQANSESRTSQASLSSAQASPVSLTRQPKKICSWFKQAILPHQNKQQVRTSNPFEDEYDVSKNPFQNDTTNPFVESNDEEEDYYDKILNPFAE